MADDSSSRAVSLSELPTDISENYINVDNSDYMRNGDFVPTRLQAQQDAVNLVCHSKTRANPENNVGLLTMSSIEVLATLTSDVGRILSKLHQVQPRGDLKFSTAVKVAHLALKHRQGRNHKMRIVMFVGSPVEDDEKELIKLAKKLKKEKVNLDIVNFGEEGLNTDKLTAMVNTMNGKEGTSSHLVTVPPGPMLSEALMNSPVVVGEDGSGAALQAVGFEFGVDPNEDPELALALRVSMEEQRARQEDEAKKTAASVAETTAPVQESGGSNDEAMLEQALAMSMQPPEADFSTMTEEEQMAYAVQMSLQASEENTPAPMDVDDEAKGETKPEKEEKKSPDDDYSEELSDPDFLQSVLESLPGVDTTSEAIQNAMSTLKKDSGKKDDTKKEKDKDSK